MPTIKPRAAKPKTAIAAKAKKSLAAKAKAPSKAKKPAAPKKKLGGAKVKPAAKKSNSLSWFHKLSKSAQLAYIRAHPNSMYAKKGAKSGGKVATAKKPTSKPRANPKHSDSEASHSITSEIEKLKRDIKRHREDLKSNRGDAPYQGRNRMLISNEIFYAQTEIKKLKLKRAEQRKADRKKK